jgi:hypothetical protein
LNFAKLIKHQVINTLRQVIHFFPDILYHMFLVSFAGWFFSPTLLTLEHFRIIFVTFSNMHHYFDDLMQSHSLKCIYMLVSTRYVTVAQTSLLTSGLEYLTVYLIYICLIHNSSIESSKLSPRFCPHICSFFAFSYSGYSWTISLQNIWCHPWIFSFFHSPHPIYHSSSFLPTKYI